MDVLATADEFTVPELREMADGLRSMARRWRELHGSEGIGTYLDRWSERFAAFAAARDGGPYPAEVAFDELRSEPVAELIEAHRFLRQVSDDSGGDGLVAAAMAMTSFPVEVALVGHGVVEAEPVPTDELILA